MPSAFLQKISDERDISMRALEEIYEKASHIAERKLDPEDPNFYKYVTSLFKSMLGMSSDPEIQAFAQTVPSRIESVSQCFTED